MASQEALHEFLDYSAHVYPNRTAVEEPGKGTMTYRDLALLSNQLRDFLHRVGVRPGDRVGIYMRKSIDTVVAIFGILKAGAAYVPVDSGAPVSRNAYILTNCSVTAVVVESCFEEALRTEIMKDDKVPYLLCLEGTGGGGFLRKALKQEQTWDARSSRENSCTLAAGTAVPSAGDLAYILYTSGSTGLPKGVMLSHRNAVSFVDWCSDAFMPNEMDRFSSHAPFHFDLSILDLYVPIKHGATLILIGEEIGKNPVQLASLISEKQISIWYSTPSVLSLLSQYGKLEKHDYSALRIILFAGEVFPVKHLRALNALLPEPKYYNLYGPTETNVCTFYGIPDCIPETCAEPFPIGKACSHVKTKVIDTSGDEVSVGQQGELCVSGVTVMGGYWNLPEQDAHVFLEDCSGQRWYKTGDIVIEGVDGNYIFVDRRDRMVKRRGDRVELGEIEVGLYRHPSIEEAAVIGLSNAESEVQIKAFLSCRDGKRLSLIELKRFCAENLPIYMIPDRFSVYEALPKTSTDKIDYQKLKAMD